MKLEGAVLFDGRSPHGHDVCFLAVPITESLEIYPANSHEGGPIKTIPFSQLKVDPPLGGETWTLRLPGGAVCECPPDHYDALVPLLKPPVALRLSHWAERSLRIGIACLVVSVLLIASFFRFGIPFIAMHAAQKIPAEIEISIASEAMKLLDKTLFRPSELPEERRELLRDEFAGLVDRYGPVPDYRIEFRRSRIGPNAFALPAGLIVMTDELVELAGSDEQIFAVLAHELGHVYHMHGMRSALQAAGHALLITVFLGDVASALSIAAAFPSILVETGYSRKFEREADAFAAQFAMETGIGVAPLVEILEALTSSYDDSNHQTWLSTHPSTKERTRLLLAFEKENRILTD